MAASSSTCFPKSMLIGELTKEQICFHVPEHFSVQIENENLSVLCKSLGRRVNIHRESLPDRIFVQEPDKVQLLQTSSQTTVETDFRSLRLLRVIWSMYKIYLRRTDIPYTNMMILEGKKFAQKTRFSYRERIPVKFDPRKKWQIYTLLASVLFFPPWIVS